jgi:hypothetical protein
MHLPRGKNLIILATAFLALIVSVVLLEQSVLRHTDGNIAFPLDNAFVDITVGRNLAFYQVWGVSKFAFQSASSSLLYPIALVPLFFIFGPHLIIPIIANALAAMVFLAALQRALIRRGAPSIIQLGVLLVAILVIPLPLLIVSGTSYTLQLLFAFLFLESLTTTLTPDLSPLPRSVYIYGVLMIGARYENIVLLAVACFLLLLLRRRTQAVKLAAISLSPMLIFGAISLIKGSNFLPNPLSLGPYHQTTIIVLVCTIIIGVILILQYSRSAAAKKPVSPYRLSFALMVLVALPFITRNITVLRHFQQDSIAIYQQEYPLAAFVHRYYKKSSVGINDIGAVAWFSDGRKLDFTGLASADVTRHKTAHSWSPKWADSLSRKDGVPTIMVSDPWFSPEQFPRWGKVASWRLPDSEHSKGRTYSFYVTNQRDTSWLLRCLRNYQPTLPSSIVVQYY